MKMFVEYRLEKTEDVMSRAYWMRPHEISDGNMDSFGN
jgi:hypothetical protein